LPVAESIEHKRILFVDDDSNLLEGLRDALRPFRRRWGMSFVTSGDEALGVLARHQHDVVISDLRMPGMDGATLLAEVRETQPAAVRIVLSGQAELRTVARAAGVAHRLLAKPVEVHELARVIERSCALRDLTDRVERKRELAGISSLPAAPRPSLQLTELLARGERSAEVLALALSAEAFREFEISRPIAGFDLDELERHSARVARVARAICERTSEADEAFVAGLLHDIGLLAMACQDRGELAASLAVARRQGRPLHEVERERTGVTHGDVGAHLLLQWGLPHAVAESVARHHEPPSPDGAFDTVAATYVANGLISEVESGGREARPPQELLDSDYLAAAGLESRLPRWRELARRQFDCSQ
jgi:putative nucleotidyltransferase with HDIG domain